MEMSTEEPHMRGICPELICDETLPCDDDMLTQAAKDRMLAEFLEQLNEIADLDPRQDSIFFTAPGAGGWSSEWGVEGRQTTYSQLPPVPTFDDCDIQETQDDFFYVGGCDSLEDPLTPTLTPSPDPCTVDYNAINSKRCNAPVDDEL